MEQSNQFLLEFSNDERRNDYICWWLNLSWTLFSSIFGWLFFYFGGSPPKGGVLLLLKNAFYNSHTFNTLTLAFLCNFTRRRYTFNLFSLFLKNYLFISRSFKYLGQVFLFFKIRSIRKEKKQTTKFTPFFKKRKK